MWSTAFHQVHGWTVEDVGPQKRPLLISAKPLHQIPHFAESREGAVLEALRRVVRVLDVVQEEA